jgi:hypothetical protein
MSSNDTGGDGVWLAMMGSPTPLDANIGAKNTQVVQFRFFVKVPAQITQSGRASESGNEAFKSNINIKGFGATEKATGGLLLMVTDVQIYDIRAERSLVCSRRKVNHGHLISSKMVVILKVILSGYFFIMFSCLLYALEFLFFRKYGVPVILHRNDNPAIGICLVQRLVQRADVAFAVIRILALRVGVVYKQPHSQPVTGFRILDHLHVAVGVAEGEERTLADVLVNPHRLARLVVNEVDFGHAH